MRLARFLFGFLAALFSLLGGALLGNWFGDRLRTQATGKTDHQFQWLHQSEQGETIFAINPLLSNFLPAVFIGLVRRPRWFWAFLSGLGLSALVGDRYEQSFLNALGITEPALDLKQE